MMKYSRLVAVQSLPDAVISIFYCCGIWRGQNLTKKLSLQAVGSQVLSFVPLIQLEYKSSGS